MSELILIPPCDTYGDVFSIVGMLYFLSNNYYDTIYLYLIGDHIISFYNLYFENNSKIIIINSKNVKKYINSQLDICNVHTGSWNNNRNNFILKDCKKIIKNYFCFNNPFYNVLKIEEKFLTKPNIKLPLKNIETNHEVYYKMLGLNNNVRMDFFDYKRNLEKEKEIEKIAFSKFNIGLDEKYIVVNSYGRNNFLELIKEKKIKYIDIHNLSNFTGYCLGIIEKSCEINLIEGMNTNFIYHCQYKEIIDIKNIKINLYLKFRNRNWPQFRLDYAYKMYQNPVLENWNFIN